MTLPSPQNQCTTADYGASLAMPVLPWTEPCSAPMPTVLGVPPAGVCDLSHTHAVLVSISSALSKELAAGGPAIPAVPLLCEHVADTSICESKQMPKCFQIETSSCVCTPILSAPGGVHFSDVNILESGLQLTPHFTGPCNCYQSQRNLDVAQTCEELCYRDHLM